MKAEWDVTLPDGRTTTVWREYPGWDVDAVDWMANDGNDACDCQLAKLIREQFDASYPHTDCGEVLQVTSIRIIADPATSRICPTNALRSA